MAHSFLKPGSQGLKIDTKDADGELVGEPMKQSYILRHRKQYRTRLQFPLLRKRFLLCRQLEKILSEIDGVESAKVRPVTGSIILSHPERLISLLEIRSAVQHSYSSFQDRSAETTAVHGRSDGCPAASSPQHHERMYHVPGLTLVVSGIYLLFLYLKKLSPLAVSTISLGVGILPALITLGLSLPIQRQALDNLSETGKPDMGLISTGLLYVSLFTGNVLSSYTVFWLFNLSGWLESKIKTKTRQTIREMLAGKEAKSWLMQDGCEMEVDVVELMVGDTIVLRLGNNIPVDGIVDSGIALVNESTLTGESVPVRKDIGDTVLTGTTVETGEVYVTVTQTGEDTRFASIVRLIESAENDPGQLQLTSRRFSQLMVPVSLTLAGTILLLTGNLLQAIAVLIITCPCALRLSTSVAISSAMAWAAEQGVLIKGGRYIEAAAKVNVLVVDKTGTITSVNSSSLAVHSFDNRYNEQTLVQLAAATQKVWPHPVGRSILAKAREHHLEMLECLESKFSVGRGVSGRINGRSVLFGSRDFLRESGVVFSSPDIPLDGRQSSSTLLYLATEGRLLASFSSEQAVRSGTEGAMHRLRMCGVEKLILLTGDKENGTAAVAEALGFDHVGCQQSPEDKAYWIRDYHKSDNSRVIGMVGDGINDTPAFAAADLSISIGDTGADITVEYSDVVLQNGGLEKVADLIELGKATEATLKKSYSIAIGMNMLTLIVTGAGLVSPVVGALAHNLITLLAVGNAANPKNYKAGCIKRFPDTKV